MKNINQSTLLVILVLGFSCLSFISEKWTKHTFQKHKYAVQFPGTPTESTQNVNSQIGVLIMESQTLDFSEKEDTDNLIYMSIYTEYPKEAVSSSNKKIVEPFLGGAVNGVIQNTGGTLLWQKDIKKDGYPGKEIKVSLPDESAHIRMRVYLVENVTYILQTISLPQKSDNESITKFMNSFELI